MGNKTPKTTELEVGRDARTGYFIPVSEAERRPNTTVVEKIERPSNTHKPSKR